MEEPYLNLLRSLLEQGDYKSSGRAGMPGTYSLFGREMRFDLTEGFPLLTTKKVSFKNVKVELLWFLRGETNIKFLLDHDCNIWNQDAFRWYKTQCERAGMEPEYGTLGGFTSAVKAYGTKEVFQGYRLGDLGPIYGAQWRNWNGILDQFAEVLEQVDKNPFGRRHIVSAWNPLQIPSMSLPPCHVLFHFYARKDGIATKLDLFMYQRSCDMFLGVPYNIASYALLLNLVAWKLGFAPGEFVWYGGDVHIYENHVEAVKEQIEREPRRVPTLNIRAFSSQVEDIGDLDPEALQVLDYHPHPRIKAELSVGNS